MSNPVTATVVSPASQPFESYGQQKQSIKVQLPNNEQIKLYFFEGQKPYVDLVKGQEISLVEKVSKKGNPYWTLANSSKKTSGNSRQKFEDAATSVLWCFDQLKKQRPNLSDEAISTLASAVFQKVVN